LSPPERAFAEAAVEALPPLGRDADGPVFAAPWEAHAFALAVRLHEQGLFTWPEWAETLGEEIERAQARGDADTGETYYLHWLAALERLVAEKGAVEADELAACQSAWDTAAKATPHGEPIVLGRRRQPGTTAPS
jgi:nitrile hydratase accessory protein